MKVAIEQVQPHCPSCGAALGAEDRSWHLDCRPHLPHCYECKEPVLAIFSRPQVITGAASVEPTAR